MKKILVLYYSQTGQLTRIVENLTGSIKEEFELDYVDYQPKKPFPFPWTTASFFDIMPETFLEHPIELKEPNIPEKDYDLIILGYQPWFLSPSLPVSSLLQNDRVMRYFKNKPVITVVGARNMWVNANKKLQKYFEKYDANQVANIALYDRHSNWVSGLTIIHWMFSGKKTKKWGFLPKPGVSEADIKKVSEYSGLIAYALNNDEWDSLQEQVIAKKMMNIPTPILFIESRAPKLFDVWANLILRKGTTPRKRKFWVNFYKYYLIIALFIVAPIILLMFNIFVRPFIFAKIKADKNRILKLSPK